MPETIPLDLVEEKLQKANDFIGQSKKSAKLEPKQEVCWLNLPYEIWLTILVDYGLTAKELGLLEQTCSWFSWKGVTEDAARLIHRRMTPRVGELANRVLGETWKEKLHNLESTIEKLPLLSSGSYQNIVIQKDKALTWGAGRFGQLGNNKRIDTPQFQEISQFIAAESGRVVQVSAGCGHSGLVTEHGHAYTFGDNRYNQLGHTHQRSLMSSFPTRVCKELASKHVLQIACGSSHTLFLDDTGHLYVNGEGDCGQLGLDMRRATVQEPTIVPFPYDEYSIIYITTGIGHNILLTHCGKAFTFGLATSGQLGHGGTKNLFQPTMVSVLHEKRIVSAAAGVSHSVFVDSEGSAYTCGRGKPFLGHGDDRIRTVPTKICTFEAMGVKIAKVAAGIGKTIFISTKGQAYWCGEGSGAVEKTPVLLDLPEPVLSASIGDSHTVLLMESGRLMTMGKNGRFQTGALDENKVIADFSYIDS